MTYTRQETSYKEHCRKALEQNPVALSSTFNPDGSLKPPLKMAKFGRRELPKEMPENELHKLKKDGWQPPIIETDSSRESEELEVTGTEIKIKGRKLDLDILVLPKKINRKDYNRIWMHNSRIRQRIKKLKEKYGDRIPL